MPSPCSFPFALSGVTPSASRFGLPLGLPLPLGTLGKEVGAANAADEPADDAAQKEEEEWWGMKDEDEDEEWEGGSALPRPPLPPPG